MAKIDSFEMYNFSEKTKERNLKRKILKVKKDKTPGLERIANLYEGRYSEIVKGERWFPYNKYKSIEKDIKELDYTLTDIEDFCHLIQKLKKCNKFPWVGIYINDLILNKAKDGDKIFLNLGKYKLDFVGENLDKDITITYNGDARNDAGAKMKKGKLIIVGDTKENVGLFMEGGIIEVHGYCYWCAGQGLKGGELRIYGDGGYRLGMAMQKGKITAESAESYAGCDIEGGEVIIKNDAWSSPGYQMKEGKITIGGDCDLPGYSMTGGEIHVLGDAGTDVGRFIKGGKIFLYGGYTNLSDKLFGGEIFDRRKRIWPK